MIFLIINLVLGLAGFVLAGYISYSKRNKHKPLVCPLSGSCHNVIHSRYSKLFKIPLEIWGLIYYGSIIVFYLQTIATENSVKPLWSLVIIFMSTIAFFVSIYLTYIQVNKLKIWCTWCLFSAGLCSLIFFNTIVSIL